MKSVSAPRQTRRIWKPVWKGVIPAVVLLVVIARVLAQDPAWWAGRGVTSEDSPADFSPANQGQLKWMAAQAREEMDAMLVELGGAGSNVAALVDGFSGANDYLPLNQGQLKALAQPFYDRLAALAAVVPSLTNAYPEGITPPYPWTATTSDDADFAPVNVGQVKFVFSFDFDRDADDIPDWCESQHGLDPTDAEGDQGADGDPDMDGLSNLEEYQAGGHPQWADEWIGEVGSQTVEQTGATNWHTVTFQSTYTNPVVIMQPPSRNDAAKTTIRLRNVTTQQFEFQIDEWDYLDGVHGEETVHYLVVESGVHILPGGHLVEAGTRSAHNAGWFAQSFGAPFAAAPAVLSQVQTRNDAAAVVTRHRNVSSSGFEVRLQEEEAAATTHATETVGYVAIAAGVGQVGPLVYEADITPNSVTHAPYALGFSAPFTGSPRFLASIATIIGPDPCSLRFLSLDAGGASIFVEEEQSADAEVNHIAENVAYAAIEAPAGRIPAPVDYDRDGLGNQQETQLGTDPYNPDTDGDGRQDGLEILIGTDPLVADAIPTNAPFDLFTVLEPWAGSP